MSSCITLKEAQLLLREAATGLAPVVKDTLELWLQAANDLPCRVQHPCIATATCLVQSALQQAPWRYPDCQHKQLAWLQKHLPAVSSAMRECVFNQVEISARRICILQSLVEGSQQQSQEQLSARAEVERKSFLLLTILGSAQLLLHPVASVCDGLSWSSTPGPYISGSRRTQAYQHQQHSLQQGNEMITEVMLSISLMAGPRLQLMRDAETMSLQLKELGVPASEGPSEVWDSIHHMQHLQRVANVVWLQLGSSMPPGHPDAWMVAVAVDWSVIRSDDWDEDTRTHMMALVNDVFKRGLLGVRHTFSVMVRRRAPPEFWSMLCKMKLTPGTLKALGFSTENEQQLLSLMREAGADIAPDDSQDPSSSPAESSASSSLEGGDQGKESAAGNKEESGFASGDDEVLNDMQALLQLMYGCSLK